MIRRKLNEQELHLDIKIGDKVVKKSSKNFKSGLRINTVSGFTTHPVLGSIALLFEEDDSIMDIRRCVPFRGSSVLFVNNNDLSEEGYSILPNNNEILLIISKIDGKMYKRMKRAVKFI